jgi:pimeloyl-ACP methyl ester carboxylesterase
MKIFSAAGAIAPLLAAVVMLTPLIADAHKVGSLDFSPCTLAAKGRSGAVAAECARLAVPENPAVPEGRRIELRVALVQARTPKVGADMVTLLAGGPGQAAIDAFPDVADTFEPLRKHHAILLVDQRGTGGSHPLRCEFPDWNAPSSQDPAIWKQFAQRCRQSLERDADLTQYTTDNAVNDLEAVRLAIGAPALDVVGVSYGTRVALEYLRRYPDGVRSMVLDGVVPPELPLGQEHARNLDAALAQIFGYCRTDAACRNRFGDPASTLAALQQRLVKKPMRTEVPDPVTGDWSEGTLYASTLSGIVRLYAYAPEFASLLPLLIDEAFKGRPQALLAQGRVVFGQVSDSIALGMQLSVICAEDAPYLHALPGDENTLLGTNITDMTLAQCSQWPRGRVAPDSHTPVASNKPVLLLSGAWDPVTPPRYADAVAAHLPNSRHLIAAGQGHNVMSRGCLPRLMRDFVDHLQPQDLNVDCIAEFGPTPAFVSFLGPGP